MLLVLLPGGHYRENTFHQATAARTGRARAGLAPVPGRPTTARRSAIC